MFSRRDLVRYFGVGAAIVPVIGGKAEEHAAAELIEVPKVKPIEIFKEIPKPLDLRYARKATVTFEMKDGSTRSIGFDLLASWPGRPVKPEAKFTGLLTLSEDYSSPQVDIGRVHMSGGQLL